MSAFVAAPLAGMTLAGLGCEVLRVDPPGGGLDYGRWPVTAGGASLFWAGLNRGKRSVVVDFRREEGRELVASLVVADGPGGGVLLTNLGAGGALCHDRLRERRPDVVSVQIEGFPGGRSAVDYTIAAQSGIPLVTGPQGHVGPVNSPLPTWDIAAGLNAAVAATEAFRRRQRSGSGALVRVALSDVALGLLSSLGLVDEPRLAVEPRSRDGNYLYGAFGRDFGLADGGRVMIVAITLKQWRSLVDALALAPEVAALERSRGLDLDREGDRFRARYEIAALVERWCAVRSSSEVAEVLEAHRVSWAPYGSASDFARSVAPGHQSGSPPSPPPGVGPPSAAPGAGPLSAASGAVLVRGGGPPFRFDDAPSPALDPAPALGQDTERVLSELLGLSPHEIGRLHDEGLVTSPGHGAWAEDD